MVENNHNKIQVLMVTKQSEDWRDLTKGYLSEGCLDYQITATGDREDAVEHLAEDEFDVALIGTDLNDKKGSFDPEEFYQKAREHGAVPAVYSVKDLSESNLRYVPKAQFEELDRYLEEIAPT